MAPRTNQKKISTTANSSRSTRKRSTSKLKKATAQDEFPISHAMLRQMYDAMVESRLWARDNRFKMAMSEATVVPAALSLRSRDVLSGPADNRILYPVRDPGVGIIPFDLAGVELACINVCKSRKQSVVLSFVKEDAFDSSGFDLFLKKAQAKRWPLIIVVPSNRFHQPHAEIPEIAVDGHDPIAVYRVVSESIRRARNGFGTSVIHTHSGHAVAARDGVNDPLDRFERYLAAKGLTTDRLHVSH